MNACFVLMICCVAEELHSLYVELTLLDRQLVYYNKHAGLYVDIACYPCTAVTHDSEVS